MPLPPLLFELAAATSPPYGFVAAPPVCPNTVADKPDKLNPSLCGCCIVSMSFTIELIVSGKGPKRLRAVAIG